MAAGTNWDNSTRNVAKHRVPLVSCERSRGSLLPSSLGGEGGGGRGLNCMCLGKKIPLLKRCPHFRG